MQPGRIALTGFCVLIAVMGMGRFALTPQLPLMLNEGKVTLASAGVLASLNYVGYLVGAAWAMRLSSGHARYLRLGLWSATLATCASALSGDFYWQAGLRFVAGVGGAWALVTVTTWTQEQLAARMPRLSAMVFAGPGIGILLTGLLAMVLGRLHWGSAADWLVYGGVALVITVLFSGVLPRDIAARRVTADGIDDPWVMTPPLRKLLLAYSLAGFGYILPATFLAQMAHARFHDSVVADLFWPVFGTAAALGVIGVILIGRNCAARLRLAAALLTQAVGVASVIVLPGAVGLALGALLCGGCFLAVMLLTMGMGRAFAPAHAPKIVGLLTTGYALGQLLGPLVSSAIAHVTGSLTPSLWLASAGLVAAAVLVWVAGAPAAAEVAALRVDRRLRPGIETRKNAKGASS
ncbi:MAG: YbfB/YjiJ family MFS transporter [Janthinobacterium lividum]